MYLVLEILFIIHYIIKHLSNLNILMIIPIIIHTNNSQFKKFAGINLLLFRKIIVIINNFDF